jgi:integrase
MEWCEPPKIEEKEHRTWSMEEANKYIEYARNDRFFIAFLIPIYTGMRRGEVLGLCWDNVDLENAEFKVRRSLVRTKFWRDHVERVKRNHTKKSLVIQGILFVYVW